MCVPHFDDIEYQESYAAGFGQSQRITHYPNYSPRSEAEILDDHEALLLELYMSTPLPTGDGWRCTKHLFAQFATVRSDAEKRRHTENQKILEAVERHTSNSSVAAGAASAERPRPQGSESAGGEHGQYRCSNTGTKSHGETIRGFRDCSSHVAAYYRDLLVFVDHRSHVDAYHRDRFS